MADPLKAPKVVAAFLKMSKFVSRLYWMHNCQCINLTDFGSLLTFLYYQAFRPKYHDVLKCGIN